MSLVGGDDAHGLSVAVTPLKDGPSLVLAYAVNPEDLGSDYPSETQQIVVVIWSGGVEPITVSMRIIALNALSNWKGWYNRPIALGDLGRDNYEYLYLDTAHPSTREYKRRLLKDPVRSNPASSIEVAGAADR